MHGHISQSVRACLENGFRLLNDAELLELNEPPTTSFFLVMIAQEEFAKGFLLALVARDIMPWDQRLLRAARDHTSKQLLCVVMDYLAPDIDEFFARADTILHQGGQVEVPRKVADALNILRHEKIGRWVKNTWFWVDEPTYDAEAMAISTGKQDRAKQDALYVRLSTNGAVASEPCKVSQATLQVVQDERERARRLADLTQKVLDGESHPGMDFPRIEELLRALFASIGVDDGGTQA